MGIDGYVWVLMGDEGSVSKIFHFQKVFVCQSFAKSFKFFQIQKIL